MLTGEPPFTGPTAQAIVARVMTEEPRAAHDPAAHHPAARRGGGAHGAREAAGRPVRHRGGVRRGAGEASYGTERVTATMTAAARRDAAGPGPASPCSTGCAGGSGAGRSSLQRAALPGLGARHSLWFVPPSGPGTGAGMAGDPLSGRVSDRLRRPGRTHDANLDQATGPLRSFSAPGYARGDQLHLVSRRAVDRVHPRHSTQEAAGRRRNRDHAG